jgi:hypothetical protein
VKSGTTVNLSPRRASIQCVLAFVLTWVALPSLAISADLYGESMIAPRILSSQTNITRQAPVPPVSFAEKSDEGGDGSSGQCVLEFVLAWAALPSLAISADLYADSMIAPHTLSSQTNITRQVPVSPVSFAKKFGEGGDCSSGNSRKHSDKRDKDDKKGKRDESGKKDKDNGKDQKDQKDNDDRESGKDKKEENGKKDEDDKEDNVDQRDKRDGEDKGDENGKKDEDDKEDNFDQKDKKDEGDKDKEKDRDDAVDSDEQETKDDQHDHDSNERHDHDNGAAEDQHDHEIEEGRHDHETEDDQHNQETEEGRQDQETEEGRQDQETEDDQHNQETEDDQHDQETEDDQHDQETEDDQHDQETEDDQHDDETDNEDNEATAHASEQEERGEGADEQEHQDEDDGASDVESSDADLTAGNAAVEDGSGEDPSASEWQSTLELSGIPPDNVTAGDLYLFTPDVESNSESTPVFLIAGLPLWASFDEATGELSGTPRESDVGVYEPITISARDGSVETSLPPFSIAVGSATGSVTLSWTPPMENEDGSPLVDLAGYWIYWQSEADTDPESMKIDNTGLSTIVIDNLVAGTYEFAMTSFNVDGVESARSNTITLTTQLRGSWIPAPVPVKRRAQTQQRKRRRMLPTKVSPR